MKRSLKIEYQQEICETYILQNCNSSEKVNYKKTSHLWALEIGKWSGVEICISAFEQAAKRYNVKTVCVSPGVNCFGLQTIK
jgi:hypothetical protein